MQRKVTGETLYSRHLAESSGFADNHRTCSKPVRFARFTLDVTGGRRAAKSYQVVDKRNSHPSTFLPLISPAPYTMPSRAEELFAKAEKKAASSVGWFGSSSSKWEEAADLFSQVSPIHTNPAIIWQLTGNMQAAVAYKIDNKWQESGQAYERCVHVYSILIVADRYIGKQHVASV